MWFLPLLVFGVALAAVPPADKPFYPEHAHAQLFEEFKTKYNKQYETPAEEQQRFEIFKENLLRINEMNAKYEETVYAVNRFTDLTSQEFTDRFTCWKKDKSEKPVPPAELDDLDYFEVPDAFDWRDKGMVTRVKDQGGCGSCWAFATIGSLESSYAIKYKKLMEFSEQQLVSCDDVDGRCAGGSITYACRYIESKGEMSEVDYLYEGQNGTCHYKSDKVKVYSKNCQDIAGTSEEDIKKVLYTKGPLAVAIAAGYAFQNYQSGVLTQCNDREISHAVLVVGYGEEKGTPYWLLKNSWGADFGERGYIKIKRGVNCIGFGLADITEVMAVEAK